MRADARFAGQSKVFWAHVRSISELMGYTERKTKTRPAEIKVYSLLQMMEAMVRLGLAIDQIFDYRTVAAVTAQ